MKRSYFEEKSHPKQSPFSKKNEDLIKDISMFLKGDSPPIEVIRVGLDIFKRQKKLERYMKVTDFFLFDWILDHDNLQLMVYLMDSLSDYLKFAMVSHNEGAALEKWVTQIATMDSEDYQKKSAIKLTLLRHILAIKPSVLIDNIQDRIHEAFKISPNPDTQRLFQSDFEGIKKDRHDDKELQLKNKFL